MRSVWPVPRTWTTLLSRSTCATSSETTSARRKARLKSKRTVVDVCHAASRRVGGGCKLHPPPS